MSRKKDKKKEDDGGTGWGTFFAAAAGAAAGAALLYGAKKLVDTFTEPQPETSGWKVIDDDYQGQSVDNVDQSQGATGGSSRKMLPGPEPDSSLYGSLNNYYESYVKLDARAMEKLAKRQTKLIQDISDIFRAQHPHLPIEAVLEEGSSVDKVNVIIPDQTDLFILLDLNEANGWQLEEAMDPPYNAPGFWKIKYKIGAEGDSSETATGWHKLLDSNGNLLPGKVFDVIKEAVLEMFGTRLENPRAVLNTNSITLFDQEDGITQNVNLIPAVRRTEQGTMLMAKPHPKCPRVNSSYGDAVYDTLWTQTFCDAERSQLLSIKEARCCHLKCLKIMKAIRLNHPSQLGVYPSYVFKTILCHMLDEEDDWEDSCLPERFLDMLIMFEKSLKENFLPSYGNSKVNLLEDIEPECLTDTQRFIGRIIGRNNVEVLLVKNVAETIPLRQKLQ